MDISELPNQVLDQTPLEPAATTRKPTSLSTLSQEVLENIWVFVRPSQVISIVSSCPKGYRVYGGQAPPMLLVNSKYSSSALALFKRAFTGGQQTYHVYIHFQADVFVINNDLLPEIPCAELARIRNLAVVWDNLQLFACRVVHFNVLDFCTGLTLLILLVRYSFMGNTIITNEEPEWAEKVTALRMDVRSGQRASAIRCMRDGWGGKLAELDAQFEMQRQRQPGWVPPRVVLRFEQRRY